VFQEGLSVNQFHRRPVLLATKRAAHRAMVPVMVVKKKNRFESVFHVELSIQNAATRVKCRGKRQIPLFPLDSMPCRANLTDTYST
jgi:hypothetical protein